MQEQLFDIYLEELEGIQPLTASEERQLLQQLLGGDVEAKSRLIEGKLLQVLQTAKEYEAKGLPMGDLIQEANVALMLMVEAYQGGDFNDLLEQTVREKLQRAIMLQKEEEAVEEELAARVNVLNQVSAMMAEELGREATVSELSQRMKMTEQQVREIMKLALDAISSK